MADYKISQNPKKPKPPGVKSFWIPKLQAKKLDQKRTIIVLAIAGLAIIVGAVFAALKLTSHNIYLHSPPPNTQGTTTPQAKTSSPIRAVPAAADQAIKNAITAKDASLLNAYYAARVHVFIFGSSTNETVDASDAANLINNGLLGAQTPWDFNVSANDLADWQAGPYSQYFGGIDEVGISSNDEVISIQFDSNGQIDSVFIAPVSVLGTSGNTGSGSGSATGPASPVPTGATAQD